MSDKNKLKGSKFAKFLKVLGTTCLALVLSVTLTGCGKQTAATPNELVIWGFVDEDVMKPIIKDFNSSNKNITVKYYKKALDGNYENDSLNSILSGQGPDVWAIPNDWVYRHKDKLAAVPESLLKSRKVVPKDYFAGFVLDDSAFDNKIYALPPTTDVLQIYYNQQLLDDAQTRARKSLDFDSPDQDVTRILSSLPTTWQELDKIIPWITVRNGNTIQTGGIAMGTSNNVSYPQDILSLLMLQNQTKMLSDDLSQATFNLPIKNSAGTDVFPGKSSLEFYSKYSDPNSPYYSWNSSMPNDVSAFVQGKVTAIYAYSGLSSYLKQSYPQLQFITGLVPQVGDLNPILDYAHYTTYVVPEQSAAADLAWEFILTLSTDSAPTYKSATKELSAKKFQGDQQVLKSRASNNSTSDELIGTMRTWNKGRYPAEVDSQLRQSVDRYNSRSQGAQASLDTAAANVTSLLRKPGW